jgi:RNA-directed DNA polymerase
MVQVEIPSRRAEPRRSQRVHSSDETGQRRWSEGTQEGKRVMKTPKETKTATVPERDKQAGEKPVAPTHVAVMGIEPEVWTERMQTALVRGLKGNQWFSLIDKVYADRTLELAWEKVESNAGGSGVDHITTARFAKDCPRGLLDLKEQLRTASYQPLPVKRVWIPKPGTNEKRPLGIPAVRDRIVQTALRMVIEPIFEHRFAEHSYGFRPGRGCKDALRRVQTLLDEGCTWIVDADLKAYFDTIPKDRLMDRVKERIADSRVLTLIRSYLDQGVMEELTLHEPTERGTPQGAVISPLLANIYLDPMDHLLAANGVEMVRYADDFVLLCRSEEAAKAALARVQTWVAENGLTLHPEKTRLVDVTQPGGFDFLGYHFERGYRWPRRKALDRFKDKVRELTPRNSGQSMEESVGQLNDMLRGWFGYFQHSSRTGFRGLDGYVRGRLRSILRKRAGRHGTGRGKDHQRWRNDYFDELGLFSLSQAHAEVRLSPRGV